MATKKLSQATIKKMAIAGLNVTLGLIPVIDDLSPADEKALESIVEIKVAWEKKATAAFKVFVDMGITPTSDQVNMWVSKNFKNKDYATYDKFVTAFETLSTKTLDNPVARLATWLSNKTSYGAADWLAALVTTPTGKFGVIGTIKGESATTDNADARSKSTYIMTEIGLAKANAFPTDDSNAARLCKALINDGSAEFTYSLIKAINGPALNVHKVMGGMWAIDPDGVRVYDKAKAYLVPKDATLWRFESKPEK